MMPVWKMKAFNSFQKGLFAMNYNFQFMTFISFFLPFLIILDFLSFSCFFEFFDFLFFPSNFAYLIPLHFNNVKKLN